MSATRKARLLEAGEGASVHPLPSLQRGVGCLSLFKIVSLLFPFLPIQRVSQAALLKCYNPFLLFQLTTRKGS